MRLQERGKTDVTYKPCVGASDDVRQWGAGAAIRATLQPAGGKLLAEMYGERLQKMKLMLYDGALPINEGAGVCVSVAADQPCDYLIVSAEGWAGHQRAVLEYIPESRRA